MTQTISAVYDKVIAFECIDANTQRVASGTAFWLNVNGKVKLVTAAHIPWPQLPPPAPIACGSLFCVSWSGTGGRANSGRARILAHPRAPQVDYAWIEFDDASLAPPGSNNPFHMSPQCANIDTSVAAIGFPGAFVGFNPNPDYAIGVVRCIQNPPGSKIFIAGEACGGYSGGPAFQYVDEDTLDDSVIGVMCGAPTQNTNISFSVAYSYILEGSKSFV